MSRFRLVSTSVLAIAFGVAACSLTTSLDGYSGAVPPSEAGNDAADATTDADADADAGGGKDGGRFCASLTPSPTFCDDFDEEGPFTPWVETRVNAGSTITRDHGAFRSAPSSLLTVSQGSAMGGGAAFLRLTSPSAVRRARFAYDLRVDARDPQTGYAEVSYLRFGGADKVYAFYVRLFHDPARTTAFTAEAYLPDGGIPQHNVNLAGDPKFTDWTRIVVDVDLRTAPHVTVTVDGALAGETTLEPSLYPPSVATVEPGVGYAGSPAGAWKLRYDNVAVDWEP